MVMAATTQSTLPEATASRRSLDAMATNSKSFDLNSVFEGAASQFRGLNPNEPGQWPVLPKLGVLLALLIAGAATLVVLASSDDPYAVRSAFQAGAQAYLLKSASPGVVTDGVRRVLEGGLYADPSVAPLLAARPEAGREPIPRLGDAEHYPLSHAQRNLYFRYQLDPGDRLEWMTDHLRLDGALRHGLLERALVASGTALTTVAMPVATFTTMGKKEIRKAVMTAGTMPLPNQITSTGTTATLGTELKPISSGYSAR